MACSFQPPAGSPHSKPWPYWAAGQDGGPDDRPLGTEWDVWFLHGQLGCTVDSAAILRSIHRVYLRPSRPGRPAASGTLGLEVTVVVIALMGFAHAAPAVAVDASHYRPWEPVVLSWSDGPGNALDWVALARAGTPESSYEVWVYVDGLADGAVAFHDAPAGELVARFYEDNGFTLLAESSPFEVGPEPGATAGVWVRPIPHQAGGPVAVNFAYAPGNEFDWVTVAPLGSDPSSYGDYDWLYGAHNGVVILDAGTTPGWYVARLYPNSTFDPVAMSAPFRVD